MTVKELKEKLNEFPDHLIVMIPNQEWPYAYESDVPAKNVSRGVNEFDGCLFIDNYEEYNHINLELERLFQLNDERVSEMIAFNEEYGNSNTEG